MTNESKGNGGKAESLLTLLKLNLTEADCERCLAELTAYVAVQLEGGDYQTQFPFTVRHLDGCVACAEVYARIYEVELAEKNGRFDRLSLLQPTRIPEPDLSFLTPSVALWAALKTALTQSKERLTLQLDTVLAALLVPQPTLAATRAAEDGRFGSQLLALTPEQIPETSLPFSLAAYADKENSDLCLLEITVEPPGLSWPDLGGRAVTVNYRGGLTTEITDDWGTAVFPNIPRAELENLRFEIEWDR